MTTTTKIDRLRGRHLRLLEAHDRAWHEMHRARLRGDAQDVVAHLRSDVVDAAKAVREARRGVDEARRLGRNRPRGPRHPRSSPALPAKSKEME